MDRDRMINEAIVKLALIRDADRQRIERVAADLERYTYEPIFLFPVPGFLRMDKLSVVGYIKGLENMGEEEIRSFGILGDESPDELVGRQLKMVIRNFSLLSRLREDEPEAWDEIHELYEDD